MLFSIHRLSCLGWYLWACSFSCRTVEASASASFPSTVEFDLVFPRNETYALAPLFPFVFAVQNPQLAAALNPSISFRTFRTDDYDATITSYEIDLSAANFSERSPYFTYRGTKAFHEAEGTWVIAWEAAAGNCSYGSGVDGAVGFSVSRPSRSITFTTRKGGQQPDVVAATKGGVCGMNSTGSARTFNLTGVIDLTKVDVISKLSVQGSPFKGRDSCAVLSPLQPHPSPNPYAVKVSSDMAMSISAKLTASACRGDPHPVVTCAPAENFASKLGNNLSVGVAGLWLVGALVCFHF
ncbi:hypothetical protein VFPPC_00085 [Pochonia chlamydosporia 170]|uniref:DUF7136 domain-containing protein n=1 Tax=Pochonia chlamydosporia 170 TaxID=1380566 RepID=A0A179G2C5_METCM|nr:hypothetical protein VFPPC_00085 [Pochonia chlamydosporia 170]OAQ72015.1 hypothetical protein VFPPC_00085 [Pochonia chlamydosporia 170]